MVAIPIIEGVYVDPQGRFRSALPVNYYPIVMPQGISAGYLKPGEGLVPLGVSGPGVCRGAIVWRDKLYAVMGDWLCRIEPNGACIPLNTSDLAPIVPTVLTPIVLLAMGQSNMVGHADATTGSKTVEAGVYIWNGNDVVDGTSFSQAAFGTAPFARGGAPWANNMAVQAANEIKRKTGRDVYIILKADGARPIETFLKAATLAANGWTAAFSLENRMYPDIANAIAKVPLYGKGYVSAFMWQQGEANSADTAAVYSAKLKALINDLRGAGILSFGNVPMSVGGLVSVHPYNDTFEAAVRRVMTSDSDLNFTKSNGLPSLPDNVHFTGNSLREMGLRHAATILPFIPALAAPPVNPPIRNINGNIGGVSSGRVSMAYSFTHLAIANNKRLWLFDGTTLMQVTDTDLGDVLDVQWVDGYFMTTDGTYLVITELSSPFAVNPLKYGSSEVDPDPIIGVIKLRNEIYAVNRNTIEVFQNVGGSLFPFQRVDGGQIMRGAISAHLACVFDESLAFVGGASGESPSVYMGRNGASQSIASREVDMMLQAYSSADLALSWLDVRVDRAASYLYLHLPDQTLVYDIAASAALGSHVWFVLQSDQGQWRVAAQAWVYDARWAFDTISGAIGKMVDSVSSHWGQKVNWQITTPIIFNATNGGSIDVLELTGLPGYAAFGDAPRIAQQWSSDGVTWSGQHEISIGGAGQRNKRLAWLRCGPIKNWRIQRFTGTSDAHLPIARLEATIRPSQW